MSTVPLPERTEAEITRLTEEIALLRRAHDQRMIDLRDLRKRELDALDEIQRLRKALRGIADADPRLPNGYDGCRRAAREALRGES